MSTVLTMRVVAALLGGLGIGLSAQAQTYACGFATGNPILFTTSVPVPESFGTRYDAFGNHRASVRATSRGGDLYIRYPDGTLRNLTQEAGFGRPLANGDEDPARSIAVRDPAPHWSGTKALFSMVVGAPAKIWDSPEFYWQLYEVSGLCPGEKVKITKLRQPARYNHLQPVYGSDDRIVFASDMPPAGPSARHLYPLLDEYEGNPITSGLWHLDRVTGQATLLNHTPSGAFGPSIDSAGRLIFSRWDHLKRAMRPPALSGGDACGNDTEGGAPIFDYANETATARTACPGTLFDEVFPELQPNVMSRLVQLKRVPANFEARWASNQFNHFFPWMMNQDGTGEETLNHVGRHEFNGSYLEPSRRDDPALTYNLTQYAADPSTATLADIAGIHHLRESPYRPGRFYAVIAHEIGARTSGQLVRIDGGPRVNAADMRITYLTPRETRYPLSSSSVPAAMSGLYRQPLPLSDGRLVAVHVPPVGWPSAVDHAEGESADSPWQLRLRWMKPSAEGQVQPGAYLTPGLQKTVRFWYGGSFQRHYSGVLWEQDPVELRVSPPPPLTQASVARVEARVLTQQGVNWPALQRWMRERELALVVVRNATQRDHSDEQQPYNLRVPGGTSSIAPDCHAAQGCRIYDVDTLQLFEARYLRSKSWNYDGSAHFEPSQPEGRRVLPRLLESSGPLSRVDAALTNPASVKGKLPGSLKVFADGSVAGFVPARRALSWQLVNSRQPGDPRIGTDAVVRERYWVTFQPGELRTCASCHGVNKTDQLGRPADTHAPQALKVLLQAWKKMASEGR